MPWKATDLIMILFPSVPVQSILLNGKMLLQGRSCPLQNVAYFHIPVPIYFLFQGGSHIVATKIVSFKNQQSLGRSKHRNQIVHI